MAQHGPQASRIVQTNTFQASLYQTRQKENEDTYIITAGPNVLGQNHRAAYQMPQISNAVHVADAVLQDYTKHSPAQHSRYMHVTQVTATEFKNGGLKTR